MTLTLKAKVLGGRLVLDEPVDLPDGTVVDLVPAEHGDELDEEDRRRLHESLHRSADQFQRGLGIPSAEALERLRNDPAK